MSSKNLSNSTISISQLARREKMVSSIEAGFPFQLRPCPQGKHHDRSAPCIEAAYVKKVYDRRPLMNSIRGAVKLNVLKYNQINDRSAPKIDPTARIQYVERKDFLDKVLIGAQAFYNNLLSAATFAQAKAGQLYEKGVSTASDVSAVAKETAHTAQDKAKETAQSAQVKAKETAHTAQAKAEGLLQSSKGLANDILEAGKDTAHAAQVRANDLLETGQEKAAAVQKSASRKVAAARYTFNDLFLSGKEKLLSRQSQEKNSESHRQLLADIAANRQVLLVHVQPSAINDRSKPFIPAARGSMTRVIDSRNRVLSEIQRKATVRSLHHVSVRDGSKPAIAGVSTIKQNDRKALLAEVKADHQLQHAECADRSAPVIPQESLGLNTKVREAVLKQVEKGVDLNQNKLVMDRSAPQLPTM